MALDGIYLRHIKTELEEKLLGGRVDKIHQPSKDELVFTIRTREGTFKLLLSARPDTARVHLTKISLENPKQPPMLCMLLRKKLGGARLMSVTQKGLERALSFEFDTVNEIGDRVRLTIVTEIMGKHSNIILVNEEGKIIDALKRVDDQMSSERIVFPGLIYRDPPAQNKLCILDTPTDTIVEKIKEKQSYLNKALMNVLQGISPIVSRELEHIITRGKGGSTSELSEYDNTRLVKAIDNLRETAQNSSGNPHMVVTDKPMDFSFINIEQYGDQALISEGDSFSYLVDEYYEQRDSAIRIKVKSSDLLKLLSNREERLNRKILQQKEELKECDKKEEIRIKAELLSSQAHMVKTGDTSVKIVNYYDENMKEVEIFLDPALTPTQNAQKLYKDYRRAKTAEIKLAEQIEIAEKELEYIDTVFYALTEAVTEDDLSEIRTELEEGGYAKINKKSQTKQKALIKPMEFETSDGFKVLVGRNNRQNDKLTLKDANRNDLWFHTKDIPGSHTVLVLDGKEPTNKALEETAKIAARHSKAKFSGLVPVDYTKVRYVSKPSGAKPGSVIYTNQTTVFVQLS